MPGMTSLNRFCSYCFGNVKISLMVLYICAYEPDVELEVQRNLSRRTKQIKIKNILMQTWKSLLW